MMYNSRGVSLNDSAFLSFLLINNSLTAENHSSMNSTLKPFIQLTNSNDKILITPNKNSTRAEITPSTGK